MALPTYADFFQMGIRSVLIRPSKFSAEVAQEEESTANTVMNIAASMMDETALAVDTAVAENTFGTAMRMDGPVLDRLGFDRYGDDIEGRKAASQAVVVLSVRRSGNQGCTLPKNSRASTPTGGPGLIYRTASDLVFGPGVLGPLTVFATCTTAGVIGNVSAGSITELLDKPAADPTMIVTNPTPAAGGMPREEAGQFGGRLRGYWKAARKGTLTAIKYAAETVDGIATATVLENLNPFNGNPVYRGTVIVADVNGSANAALVARVVAGLPESRGLGVPVFVTGGVPVDVAVRVDGIVFAANTATTALIENIRAAIVATVNALIPGATLRVGAIQAAIEQFAPAAQAPKNAVIVPAGDLVPPSVRAKLRTRSDLVTINGQ